MPQPQPIAQHGQKALLGQDGVLRSHFVLRFPFVQHGRYQRAGVRRRAAYQDTVEAHQPRCGHRDGAALHPNSGARPGCWTAQISIASS
ncbi:hypothetical protein ACFY41_20580 [Streptomyces syringium]|uniref:hypothetical protein n=1 Tax=Streptomyces syringium TaxID=76729 RepID=UPI00369DA92B